MRLSLSASAVLAIIALTYLGAVFFNPQDIPQYRKADAWVGLPRYFFSDGLSYYLMTKSLTERGSPEIDGALPDTLWAKGKDERFYIPHMPGLPLLAAPFYMLLGATGLYILNALLGIATCAIIYKSCRLFYPEEASAQATLLFGLGTALLTYSEVFYSEILSAATVAASFYFLLRYGKGGATRDALLCGLFAGLMPLTKPTLLVLAPLFLLFGFIRRGKLPVAFFLAGFAVAFSVFIAYNVETTGNPLKTIYDNCCWVVDGPQMRLLFDSGQYWKNNPLIVFPASTLIFLITQPILAVSAAGLIWDKMPAKALIVSAYLVLGMVYGFYYDAIGGLCWSWRFMVHILPMLALPAAAALERGRLPRGVVWVLFYISLCLTIFSLFQVSWQVQTQSWLAQLTMYRV